MGPRTRSSNKVVPHGRFFFNGGPWSQGHSVDTFHLSTFKADDGSVRMHIGMSAVPIDDEVRHVCGANLRQCATAYMYLHRRAFPVAQFPVADGVEEEDEAVVWRNYGHPMIWTLDGGEDVNRGMPLFDEVVKMDVDTLDGVEVRCDTIEGGLHGGELPDDLYDPETGMAVRHCYLRGHDMVANHYVRFTKAASGKENVIDVAWCGLYASAYTGSLNLSESWSVVMRDVPVPTMAASNTANRNNEPKCQGLDADPDADYSDLLATIRAEEAVRDRVK